MKTFEQFLDEQMGQVGIHVKDKAGALAYRLQKAHSAPTAASLQIARQSALRAKNALRKKPQTNVANDPTNIKRLKPLTPNL